jgi:iron complex transport system permease protein
LGALISIVIVYALAKTGGSIAPIRLILVGVAVSAMFRAFTNYIVYTAPNDAAVREATFWMLGGLGSAEWADIPPLAILVPLSLSVMLALAKPLNAMMMGDSSAITLGVNLNLVRKTLIVVTALLTATAVAVSGCIGFVGLVIPHIIRSVVGPDHRRLIPLAALAGAVFMIWVDVGARMIRPPTEIPVGILTAFLGAPLFLWMIHVRRYEFQ